MNKYNNNIAEIDTYINNIKSKCNHLYRDSKVNNICDTYQLTYEKLINLYVGDLQKLLDVNNIQK